MVGVSSPEMRGHMGNVCTHTNASVFHIGTRASVDFVPEGPTAKPHRHKGQ